MYGVLCKTISPTDSPNYILTIFVKSPNYWQKELCFNFVCFVLFSSLAKGIKLLTLNPHQLRLETPTIWKPIDLSPRVRKTKEKTVKKTNQSMNTGCLMRFPQIVGCTHWNSQPRYIWCMKIPMKQDKYLLHINPFTIILQFEIPHDLAVPPIKKAFYTTLILILQWWVHTIVCLVEEQGHGYVW